MDETDSIIGFGTKHIYDDLLGQSNFDIFMNFPKKQTNKLLFDDKDCQTDM
jgi:hypothetical protein